MNKGPSLPVERFLLLAGLLAGAFGSTPVPETSGRSETTIPRP